MVIIATWKLTLIARTLIRGGITELRHAKYVRYEWDFVTMKRFSNLVLVSKSHYIVGHKTSIMLDLPERNNQANSLYVATCKCMHFLHLT